MKRVASLVTAMLALLAASGCDSAATAPWTQDTPQAAAVPNDGNGNKLVLPIYVNHPVDCGSVTISRVIEGWAQIRVLAGEKNRNVEIDVFKTTATFTNSAGKKFVTRGVEADRYWLAEDRLMISLSGRIPYVEYGQTFIGILTIDLQTGSIVFQQGRTEALPRVLACEALT